MNKINIGKSLLQPIKDIVSSKDCLATHRFSKHFIRNRKHSLPQVVNYLLYTSKASMYQNLASIIDDFGLAVFPDVSKQAVSKARQGIKPDLFQDLFNHSTDTFYSNIDQRKT